MPILKLGPETFNVRIPKPSKSIHVPKYITRRLRVGDGKYVYLELLGLKHPVSVCRNKVTIPGSIRRLLREKRILGKFLSVSIARIEGTKLLFVGQLYPHFKNGKLTQYELSIHPLARKSKVIRIKVNNSEDFYDTVRRGRVSIFPRVMHILGIDPEQPQQVEAWLTNLKVADNRHLLTSPLKSSIAPDATRNGFLKLDKLLNNFFIKLSREKLLISAKTLGRETKPLKLNQNVKLGSTLFRTFGLFQAEGTKKHGEYTGITNKDPRLINYFITSVKNLFGLNTGLWRVDIQLASANRHDTKNIEELWARSLKLPSDVTIHAYKTKKGGSLGTGVATAKVISRTFNGFMLRMLEFIKMYVRINKDACGHFISGVLAGDGYPQIEGSLKCVELYFNPNKIGMPDDEAKLYLESLKLLDIMPISVRIFCDKSDREAKQRAKIARGYLKKLVDNVAIRYKRGIKGVGGTIYIRRKENFQKLAPYRPFYPKIRHACAFLDNLGESK